MTKGSYLPPLYTQIYHCLNKEGSKQPNPKPNPISRHELADDAAHDCQAYDPVDRVYYNPGYRLGFK